MLPHLVRLLRAPTQWLGTRLIIAGAWVYLRFAPIGTRVLVSFQNQATEEEDEDFPEDGPQPPPGKPTDPVFIEWLNGIYRDSPESDTRMG